MRSSLASLLCAIGAPLFLPLPAASHANDDRATVTVTAALPMEQFFENAALSGALLSPDGRQLALRVVPGDGHDRLAVLDLASMRMQPAAAFTDAAIGDFLWVNERRLAFRLTDRWQGQGRSRYGSGLYAVNSDGSAFRQLAARQGTQQSKAGRTLLPPNTILMESIGDQRGTAIHVLQTEHGEHGAVQSATLLRLDSVNGNHAEIDAPAGIRYWLYDQGGQARIATAQTDGQNRVYWRDPATEQWQLLAQFDPRSNAEDVFEPAFLTPDGHFYVSARSGGDKAALYRYTLQTRQRDVQPAVASPDHDIRASMVRSSTRLLGIRYTTDTETTVWLDEDMQAVQQSVNALLPSTVNTLSVGTRSETPFVLVASWSDTQPAIYHLYQRDTGQLTVLAKSRPGVNAARMSAKQLQHYTARDGLRIPAWLTLPRAGAGKAPAARLPLIVFVHDGPWQRGTWGWSGEAQFLASRGYAVLEPDYRGSEGLGDAHFRAGWKQWGLAMQDDLADGVRWAIAQGYADPRRVCIVGAGYGGYAALMGLARDGELYRCGVALSAVTELETIADGRWRLGASLYERYDRYPASTLIGEAPRDAAQWRASSPRHLAARITQPVLLAHGQLDRRVAASDAASLYQAIRQGNPNAEWLRYDDEGQGLTLPGNRIDFWRKVEQFLARHNAPR